MVWNVFYAELDFARDFRYPYLRFSLFKFHATKCINLKKDVKKTRLLAHTTSTHNIKNIKSNSNLNRNDNIM